MKLESKIEAILFFKAEPVSIKKLSSILEVEESDVETAIENLKKSLESRGLSIMQKEDEFMLVTSGEVSAIIEKLTKEELSRDIGKAGLETLSIVLYKGHVTRSEIDYIRGVNSSFILRNLMIRGLVERIQNPKDNRGFVYKPTFELLQYLGIESSADLPGMDKIISEIESFQKQKENIENESLEDIKEAETE